MLVSLARFQKSIAWSLMTLFYLQFVLIPIAGRAAGGYTPVKLNGRKSGFDAGSLRPFSTIPNNSLTAGRDNTDNLATDAPLFIAPPKAAAFKGAAPVIASPDGVDGGGPGQPEMSAFTSVGSANMVDLFSGDFSYNIPLMDVGGYPINLAYRAGISMDQEASWVGLGWNVNPGTVTRNMRGLPDDFEGKSDSVRKVINMKANKTIGVTGGADIELLGYPAGANKKTITDDSLVGHGITVGASVGVFHNNYRGWGLEQSFNVGINSGKGAHGFLSGGLSMTNNSQTGLTLSPSISANIEYHHAEENAGNATVGVHSISLPYNSRAGLSSLQLNSGVKRSREDVKNHTSYASQGLSLITFTHPSITPTITNPTTSLQLSFTAKLGVEIKGADPHFSLSGYMSTQDIKPADRDLSLPAYGYLHFYEGAHNRSSLRDFNREKDLPYRESPATPHIAIPVYTYDAFSITGEGTGGMFRAYRSDIGFVHDHLSKTKDYSGSASIDLGYGDLSKWGVDLNFNYTKTETGYWQKDNTMKQVIDFRRDSADFQAVYFRNPGEKSINDKAFYQTLGGDDLVTVGLEQTNKSSASIYGTNFLDKYRNGRRYRDSALTSTNTYKKERDKRTQVITYLNAREANVVGLSKYIEYHIMNEFDSASCVDPVINIDPNIGTGLWAQYYNNKYLKGTPYHEQIDPMVDFNWDKKEPCYNLPKEIRKNFPIDTFSVRWKGRIKAPQSGTFTFLLQTDDGSRLWINDSLLINNWKELTSKEASVKLVAGKFYDVRIDYFDLRNYAYAELSWKYGVKTTFEKIPTVFLYPPPQKDTFEHNYIVRELRVNDFRKSNHISEIDVLGADGRRYVYGIPVYNLKQKEATFSVANSRGNVNTGLVGYTSTGNNPDNSTANNQGNDNYFTSEEVPAYAHSFLLTGILSADYSDITGNGISDDDIGDAVKFNYTKVRGIKNPFPWRVPAVQDSATYNPGLRTDTRDDKGNYIAGEKELWYMHSIESKTMVATFILEEREDLPGVTENGDATYSGAKRLKEIRLYSKSDFATKRTKARPIKIVHFEYTYDLCKGMFAPTKGKLTLKKVWFTYDGNNKGQQNPYVFSYNSKNPTHNIQSYDRWGNYKDPAQNPGSVTGNIRSNAEYPYALQDSILAAQNAAAWALDSIHLPSGGSLKVQYESDDYGFVQNKRAMQMFRVVGTGTSSDYNSSKNSLYTKKSSGNWDDHRYIFIRVPAPVHNVRELYHTYLAGVEKLYFKLLVGMPSNKWGSGSEYITTYASIEPGQYGVVNDNIIWIKLNGLSLQGDESGVYSPLVKAATQYLRLNLPSKSYRGSEPGDNLGVQDAVNMIAGMVTNITSAFSSFDRIARNNVWAANFDTTRSVVRLNNPYLKKLGGGHRVKRITVYDNWDKMTGQRAAIYGQEYSYTTTKVVDKDSLVISSGVATFEPGLGAEENPFRVPVEYVQSIAPLGPVTLGYSEEPLGESFFPGASIGYSQVRVRTINYKDKKSANGYEETKFYTAYDYPVYTDRTIIDGDTKKRFKPTIQNLLRINSRYYLTLSQGFKVELNDMHGKMRSQAYYPETDAKNYVSYSEQFYKTDRSNPDHVVLSNTVTVIRPDGSIDTNALIGKDVELMMDMREQVTTTIAPNLNLNSDIFSMPVGIPWLMFTLWNLGQYEQNIYRSAATTKIIQRYGILDSAIQIDKGSRISTHNLMYDSETGDVLYTRTQNEFNEPVYNFSYPSHWAYDGMGLAYRNIDVKLENLTIKDGRLLGMTADMEKLFSSGDEILVAGREKIGNSGALCNDPLATFPDYYKVWAIDSSAIYGGPRAVYFIDRWGKAYTGDSLSLRIIRSGRRNILGAVGSITSLDSLVRKNTTSGQYELVTNSNTKIIAASAGEFKQLWKTDDMMRKQPTISCIPNWQPNGGINCVKSGGLNTGYQQVSTTDMNPYSPTYLDTSYTTILNCLECSLPAKWAVQDTFQCARDTAGNYTGYRLRGEIDTAGCSATYGQYRWQISAGLSCTICPRPAKWALTGTDSCLKDANGKYTGLQLKQERDTASCSSTYNNTRWQILIENCTVCKKSPDWQPVPDSIRCIKNGSSQNTGYQTRMFINREPCSDSAFSIKWDTVKNCTACVPVPVRIQLSAQCELNGSGQNTSRQIRYWKDSSACGVVLGSDTISNSTSCPPPNPTTSCIYAKIYYDSVTTTSIGDGSSETYAKVMISFYTNSSYTTPAVVYNFNAPYIVNFGPYPPSSYGGSIYCDGVSSKLIEVTRIARTTAPGPMEPQFDEYWTYTVDGTNTQGYICNAGSGGGSTFKVIIQYDVARANTVQPIKSSTASPK